MGFILGTLGPGDQATVRNLQGPIITTLRSAAASVRSGAADNQCQLWFGDSSQGFKAQLAGQLSRFASVINTTPITINCEHWKRRDADTFAAAHQPTGGWNAYTNLTTAQGQGFTITLDLSFSTAPTYRPNPLVAGDTKFQTLVHELSHLVIGTDDHAYGPVPCRGLAISNSNQGKNNADSWGYFVEDLR